MALYELRTYTLYVGKLGEAQKLYQELGWPGLQPDSGKLIGYFIGDVGAMNQIVHLWRFEDDADRRALAAKVLGDLGERGLLIRSRDEGGTGSDEARAVLNRLNRPEA